ncbi:MAG: DUF1565 domain-containing protein [bacterium]
MLLRRLIALLVPLVAAPFPSCGSNGGDGNHNVAPCPAGFVAEGPACVPRFDGCDGPAELALLGGGCRQVGVTECATGFESDGEGGCEPLLPPGTEPCPAVSMAMVGHASCQPVGVTACATGFVSDNTGGCEALLPPTEAPCPAGSIAVLGFPDCRPLGDCGAGPWGGIVGDLTTIYVDQTADATGADGSSQAPYPTITQALVQVAPGGQIAVAAGEYLERLTISKPVRLSGRCAGQVTIRGQVFLGDPLPALRIIGGGDGTTVRGVTLTGPDSGFEVTGARQVIVEDTEIVDTESYGVSVTAGGEVRMHRVKVARTTVVGVRSQGSEVALSECVVSHTLPRPSDGLFGRGIDAECTPGGVCGRLTMAQSVVSRNRDSGIFALGPALTVTTSVVRSTQVQLADGRSAAGIAVGCSPDPVECGDLQLTSSLVSWNYGSGVTSFGADIALVANTIRHTLPETSQSGGAGVVARCDQALGICGRLDVSGSLLTENTIGVLVEGVSGAISQTIVRDAALIGDGSGGWGISGTCDNLLSSCGSLAVSDSLIHHNTVGIHAKGLQTTVSGTEVRDGIPLGDGLGGWGIAAVCNRQLSACGSLRVEQSLVTRNLVHGIYTEGVDTEVAGSVIRDTLERYSDADYGRGIVAHCDEEDATCGTLTVAGSLVSGSKDAGIVAFGPELSVTSTVVRGTVPNLLGYGGAGIASLCDPFAGACAPLVVSASLLDDNAVMGVAVVGVDATIISSVIRQTGPPVEVPTGTGVSAVCHAEMARCGQLWITGTLLSHNTDEGVYAAGVQTTIRDSDIRDTLTAPPEGRFGRGIDAACDPALGVCGRLTVTSSRIRNSFNAGIFVAGVPTFLEGVSVANTRPNEYGLWRDEYGQGILVRCDGRIDACDTAQLTNCSIQASHSAGLALQGVSGFVTATLVEDVAPQPDDGRYGYGIQIEGLDTQTGPAMPVFNVIDCAIHNPSLAGILYYRARGTLSGSVITGGENSVVMNEGSEPTIQDDNQLSGTIADEPTWGSVFPSPAPAPRVPQ